MKLSNQATVSATRAGRVARRVGRLRAGARFRGALTALAAIAPLVALRGLALAGDEASTNHEPAVLTAFGALVAVAIVATTVAAWCRREASDGDEESAGNRYAHDPQIPQSPDR
jgi:chromate transport protein ChrA